MRRLPTCQMFRKQSLTLFIRNVSHKRSLLKMFREFGIQTYEMRKKERTENKELWSPGLGFHHCRIFKRHLGDVGVSVLLVRCLDFGLVSQRTAKMLLLTVEKCQGQTAIKSWYFLFNVRGNCFLKGYLLRTSWNICNQGYCKIIIRIHI